MMEISKEKKEKKKRIVSIWVCILIFIGAFFAGMISKVAIKPAWSTKYTATWSEELGTKITDISYGDEEANKFDLYLPKDSTKDTYGLVIYLHAGGFTSGDKADDENMLAWLCSKGYVAAGINYTLRTDTNNASVLLQSNEIKEAIPIVVEEAKNRGYNIDKMTVAGGSAGHALAMIYALVISAIITVAIWLPLLPCTCFAAVRMISRFRGSRLFMPGCVVQSIIFHHFLSLYYRTDLSSETSRCCFPERRSRMGPFVSLYSSY